MGTISVEIDKITECLIDVNTGKEVKTIVTQIKHKEAYDYEKRY